MPRKTVNPRLGVTVTDAIYEALAQESNRTGAPISQLVRNAVEMLLVSRGYKVDATIDWGGYRARKDAEPGQTLAEPAR